jgi:hypothetical protein
MVSVGMQCIRSIDRFVAAKLETTKFNKLQRDLAFVFVLPQIDLERAFFGLNWLPGFALRIVNH